MQARPDGTAPPGGTVTAGTAAAVVEGLCRTRDAARRSSAEARRVFLDQAHPGLHEIASDAQAVDRGAAARLLEAKAAVEAALDQGPPSDRLVELVARLLDATHAALRGLALPVGDCPS